MNSCPKCGGSNGYAGNLTMSYDMQGAWGKEWETTGHDRIVHRSKRVKCVDCGARVQLAKATGGEDNFEDQP